jgi:hypothetical protein
VPVEKVGNDYYGGPHHGNNLYSDCILAVDANTGKIKWYQQLVHHDIWDFDLAAPAGADRHPPQWPDDSGVSMITKMGIMFVFNRETGEPVYGMEERPVPQTTAKGEWTSPTQPFPLKPEPLARMSLKKTELAKVTPELEAHCKGLWEKYNLSDSVPYDPWREKQDIVLFSWRGGWRQLAGRHDQQVAGLDDHERAQQRSVGTPGGTRSGSGSWWTRRTWRDPAAAPQAPRVLAVAGLVLSRRIFRRTLWRRAPDRTCRRSRPRAGASGTPPTSTAARSRLGAS